MMYDLYNFTYIVCVYCILFKDVTKTNFQCMQIQWTVESVSLSIYFFCMKRAIPIKLSAFQLCVRREQLEPGQHHTDMALNAHTMLRGRSNSVCPVLKGLLLFVEHHRPVKVI